MKIITDPKSAAILIADFMLALQLQYEGTRWEDHWGRV
jgi:hypothetical protein